ncbi:LysM peptidoglycan-binding domain-containing protein [Arthrobacter sp. MDT1-65]
MSRKISSARHRAAIDGNLALQGLSRAAKAHATMVGRPVAVVAVTSGLALSVVGTAHAGSYTEQAATPAPAAVAAQAAPAVQAAPAAPAAAADATHTVVAGDTLGGISASYGADLTAVLAANGLSLASVIFPGDSIVIPTGGAATAQTVSVPVAVAPAAPVQQAAVVAPAPVVQQAAAVAPAPAPAPAPAVSEAPGSGVYLASAEVTPAAGGAGGTLLASAQSQLAAGAVQDCTVLVENALHAAGIAAGDLGPSQFFQYGATVATPAPGDIVITGGHVAIYAGGGQVISSGMNGSNLTMQHPLSDLPGASFVRV